MMLQESQIHWYAVNTKPCQEERAAANLEEQGIVTFYPKLREKKLIRGQNRWVVGPLFPRYLFAQFSLEKHYMAVKYTRGVSRVVAFGELPTPVDDSIIEAIKARAEEGVVTIPPPEFKPGEMVEIIDGPFQGFLGIFHKKMRGSDRVMILLKTMDFCQRQLVISKDSLKKIEGER